MRQGIHPRTGNLVRRERRQCPGIDQRRIRHDRLADNRHFCPAIGIGDNRKLGNISRTPGGGRNADQWRNWILHHVDPFKILNVALMAGHNADRLGAIHWTAAAHGDNQITTGAFIQARTGSDFRSFRVFRYTFKNDAGNLRLLETVEHTARPTRSPDAGIGHQQHFLAAKIAGILACQINRALTKQKLRRHKFPQRPFCAHPDNLPTPSRIHRNRVFHSILIESVFRQ